MFNGYRVSIWDDKVFQMDNGDGCTFILLNINVCNYYFKCAIQLKVIELHT